MILSPYPLFYFTVFHIPIENVITIVSQMSNHKIKEKAKASAIKNLRKAGRLMFTHNFQRDSKSYYYSTCYSILKDTSMIFFMYPGSQM